MSVCQVSIDIDGSEYWCEKPEGHSFPHSVTVMGISGTGTVGVGVMAIITWPLRGHNEERKQAHGKQRS